ncbi:Bifunctional protein HldE [Candidatus Hartigia pinicola]|nr:Bifunctional protein HldE [Candidatus Hartigia pinicola]
MKGTIPDYKQASVLVVGDVMLDRYWHGSASRISPEAPVPLVKINMIKEQPGGAANVAMNIASLGAHSHLVGLTGIDDAAKILAESLKSVKVCCNFVAIPTHPTITKLRVISRHQQLIRLDFEEEFENIDVQPILERIEQALPYIGALVLSDYAKGALSKVHKIVSLANKADVPVLIDPKSNDFERYRNATLLTPNMAEFEAIVGYCRNYDHFKEKGTELLEHLNLKALLITRSEQGMSLFQRNKMPLHLPTEAQEVYDVTGAGDTVIGVIAASIASGCPLDEACILANAAASIVVGKLGTSTVSYIELKNAIRGRAENGFGVMNENQLKQAVINTRLRGERVVMTNGCFDMLHAGHVSYLANARKLGDRLIVAVNSDASTRRLKGNKRPVNQLEQRMIVLGALESVDWVVPFEEDTPERLINEVLPDVLVKGGDYRLEEIVGSKEVLAAGGEVKVLNFEKDISTTNIIKSIIKISK